MISVMLDNISDSGLKSLKWLKYLRNYLNVKIVNHSIVNYFINPHNVKKLLKLFLPFEVIEAKTKELYFKKFLMMVFQILILLIKQLKK